MINSNSRKLTISGWLQKNDESEYNSSLKLQKFLFFYEMISEKNEKTSDFTNLQGWKDGPVFATTYGDYTYRKDEFTQKCIEEYDANSDSVDEKIAKLSNFIISIMSEREISQFTHIFNIWKSKEDKIKSEEKKVGLEKDAIIQSDLGIIDNLEQSYPDEYINSTHIIKIRSKRFLMSQSDLENLTTEHKKTLEILADKEELVNPVYIEIDDEGVLLVD